MFATLRWLLRLGLCNVQAKVSSTASLEASDIIEDLRIELSGLKRRLATLENTQLEHNALQVSAGMLGDGPQSGQGRADVTVTKPPAGHLLDDQVDSMFERIKRMDGGFAKDARQRLAAAASDWDASGNNTFTLDMEAMNVGPTGASSDLRSGEASFATRGSGAGILDSAPPAGLAGHAAVMSRSLPPEALGGTLTGPGSVLNVPMSRAVATAGTSNVGAIATKGDITAFQHWKMRNFLWAPDTPEASQHFDSWAVERLTDASLVHHLSPTKLNGGSDDAGLNRLRRPTDGNVIKVGNVPDKPTRHDVPLTLTLTLILTLFFLTLPTGRRPPIGERYEAYQVPHAPRATYRSSGTHLLLEPAPYEWP